MTSQTWRGASSAVEDRGGGGGRCYGGKRLWLASSHCKQELPDCFAQRWPYFIQNSVNSTNHTESGLLNSGFGHFHTRSWIGYRRDFSQCDFRMNSHIVMWLWRHSRSTFGLSAMFKTQREQPDQKLRKSNTSDLSSNAPLIWTGFCLCSLLCLVCMTAVSGQDWKNSELHFVIVCS